ncbi:hypothetical protein G9A89_013854 [Geosiphon pyriformis]|nr:hypothetical protein G9A89_013854 [Geosiphon pyriformis]
MFFMKKKVVLRNVKHSGNKKDVSLVKSEFDNSIYSNVDSLSGDNEDVNMASISSEPLLGLAATTLKTKQFNTSVDFGFSLSSPNFFINDGKVILLLHVNFSLEKKWIDPKITKVQVNVSVKKPFALDINLLAVEKKSATVKTQLIRKIFQQTMFEGIIRSIFISEKSMEKATLLTKKKGIAINSDLKKQEIFNQDSADWNMTEDCGEICQIRTDRATDIKMVIPYWKELSVCDYGHGKSGYLDIDNQTHCTIIGFESENKFESAFHTKPIFGDMRLSWTRLDLFEHSALECNASDTLVSASFKKNFKKNAFDVNCLQLARLYAKKNVSISCSAAFSVFSASFSGGFQFDSGSGFFSSSALGLGGGSFLVLTNDLFSNTHLASLECFLELLSDQVSGIVCKLSNIKLVLLALSLSSGYLVALININLDLNSDIVLNSSVVMSVPSFVVLALGLSSSKILMTKVDCLEPKLVALKALIGSVLAKLDYLCAGSISIFTKSKLKGKVFTSGLESGYLGANVVVIINSSLAKYIYKISEVPGQLLSIKLFFKNKLSVSILGLYTGASLATINESFFVILSGDFNKNGSYKYAEPTWANSKGVMKMIDYVFVFSNLVNAIVHHDVLEVNEHFNTDYQSIFVSVDLGGLLNTQLNSLYKQNDFKDTTLANVVIFLDKFAIFMKFSDLGAIFNDVFTKKFLRFHKFEFLVSRIVKALCEKSINVVDFGAGSDHICSALFGAKKSYHTAKLTESLKAKKANINVLECSFCKIVDHLVVNDELILEPDLVKSKMDVIIEDQTKKHRVYVFDKAFSDVMYLIEFDELFGMVSNLSDGKVAGFLDTVLDMLLALLNSCLSGKLVSSFWKEAWISIIPKPYKWESVLKNTHSIALIKMTHKILFKIFSDRIFLACSTFNVLCKDNFLVLKSTITQSPIFAIGLVIEDALKKDWKLWLVLQDMWKAYNSVSWEHFEKNLVRIKIYSKFIQFFGNIYRDCTNQVMTNFGLMGGYCARLFSFFAAGAFIDDTIWVGSSQSTIQHILNVADLLKPSLAKANSDICFFTNLVLRKAILDMQFLYLVLAVLHLIVNYRTQFSFIPVGVCNNDTIHYLFFYGLKSFLQVQSKSKIVFLISFVNSGGVLGRLFFHRSYNLQVLCWCSVYSLSFSVCIHVSTSNNFLAGIVHILFNCNLSLGGSLTSSFWCCGGIPMSAYGIAYMNQLRNSYGAWFKIFATFLNSMAFSSACLLVSSGIGFLNIFNSGNFASVCNHLSWIGSDSLSVYTDGSLKDLDTVGCKAGAATFFKDINLSLGIGVLGIMSSTMAELQAIVLALECVLLSSSSELGLVYLNFRNQYWVKSHFGILENKHANVIASAAFLSGWHLLFRLDEHFIMTDGIVISGNSRHFFYDVYCSICCVCWEFGSDFKFLTGNLLYEVNWLHLLLIWHPDLHMAAGFISRPSAELILLDDLALVSIFGLA